MKLSNDNWSLFSLYSQYLELNNVHFRNLYSEVSWQTLIFQRFDELDYKTIKLINSSYSHSYLIRGLIYQESITYNITIDIDNLTISSGTFFLCPDNQDSTLFYFNNYLTTVNANNLIIQNALNCDNLKIFSLSYDIIIVISNSIIKNSRMNSFLYLENIQY